MDKETVKPVKLTGVVTYVNKVRKVTTYVMISYSIGELVSTTKASNVDMVNIPKLLDMVEFTLDQTPMNPVAKNVTILERKVHLKEFLENPDLSVQGTRRLLSLRLSDVAELLLKYKINGEPVHIFNELRARGYDYIGNLALTEKTQGPFYFIYGNS